MPLAQRPCHEHLLDVIRELEQADEVGHARPAAPDGAGHIGLRLPEVLHQDGQGLCCFDGVQVLAHEVLDQAHLQALPLVGVIPVQAILALPYVLTVLLLAGFVGKATAPAAIGVPYSKEK